MGGLSSRAYAYKPHTGMQPGYQGGFNDQDEETGWNEFDLRSYDPQIGRFIQADPFDQFPNPYTGMGNDPVNLVDPSGGETLPYFKIMSEVVINVSRTAAQQAMNVTQMAMSAISLAGNVAGVINTMSPFNEYEVIRDKKTGQVLSWRQTGTKGGDNYDYITYKEADGPMFMPREVSKVTDIPVKTVYVTNRNYNGGTTRVPGAIVKTVGEPQALGDDLVGKGFALYALGYTPLRILYDWLTADNIAGSEKVLDVVDYASKNKGAARPGYKGGKTFANDGRAGGQVLPKTDAKGNPIKYKEYDVNPYQKGVNRGDQRVVMGSDGKSYYTGNHYRTFTEIRK